MEPMLRNLSADLAAALSHARAPQIADTAHAATPPRMQVLYERFLADMGLLARRLIALSLECADAAKAFEKGETELQTARIGVDHIQHLNQVHAKLQELSPEVINLLYLHRDCLPKFFGAGTPVVYFAERYASLTEVNSLQTKFRVKEIPPTLSLEQLAMATYLRIQGNGSGHLRGNGNIRDCRTRPTSNRRR